ncbi:transmembrane and coiled-coil domain-containing protein 4 isoform X2 [Selaginella moellendorffii]|uniref:transmembrane and coiled-coil domain-containing protein 4 isoform X2 n=1 Tax=Selaginella moellendorffii TaxID=88036 RepID=UPI000D1C8102|nr:transmembrane and coiled-coil domain-containing protein 4 isoform X2 [Selaginella moellendorffii]|eukprot:XP_024536739.1 transmembrane and coiled-coil domain-containing protein 4 isoform X2 [Selaginella moellendorffii]
MAELGPVHKYAAGALFSLALNQAQSHQRSLPPRVNDDENAIAEGSQEEETPWSSEEFGLAQHVFRYLDIEKKSWMGLETTAISPDAKHHIGAFLRLLSEEDVPTTSETLPEDDLAKAIDAMSLKLEESSSTSPTRNANPPSRDSESSSAPLSDQRCSISQEIDSSVLTRQRKVAVLYELLVACVADASDEKKAFRGGYDSRYRVTLRLLATWFDVKWSKMAAMEVMVACMAMAARKEQSTAEAEAEKSKWSKWKRGSLIGAAAVTGGTLLAITGGLAAPAIAAGLAALAPAAGTVVPIIGASGFAAAAAATGTAAGSVAIAASFGAAGAGLTGSKMARRIGDVDEFGFEAIGDNHNQGRLAVAIVISGIIFEEDDFTRPWIFPDADLERYSLRWETKILMAVSSAIQDWLTTAVAKELMKRGAMMTVLSGLLAALAWPSALLSATDFIDSRWTIAVDRSDKAGEILANCLLSGLHGSRPVTLLGFSLGARVIFSCLEHLAKKGNGMLLFTWRELMILVTGGIVERVVLLGAPLSLDRKRWMNARKIVAGRFVNCYSSNDWILGVIYRASILSQGLAGIQPVALPGIENVNVTHLITGHSSYLSKIPEILETIHLDNYFPVFF